jgi:hypothetical protein
MHESPDFFNPPVKLGAIRIARLQRLANPLLQPQKAFRIPLLLPLLAPKPLRVRIMLKTRDRRGQRFPRQAVIGQLLGIVAVLGGFELGLLLGFGVGAEAEVLEVFEVERRDGVGLRGLGVRLEGGGWGVVPVGGLVFDRTDPEP